MLIGVNSFYFQCIYDSANLFLFKGITVIIIIIIIIIIMIIIIIIMIIIIITLKSKTGILSGKGMQLLITSLPGTFDNRLWILGRKCNLPKLQESF